MAGLDNENYMELNFSFRTGESKISCTLDEFWRMNMQTDKIYLLIINRQNSGNRTIFFVLSKLTENSLEKS